MKGDKPTKGEILDFMTAVAKGKVDEVEKEINAGFPENTRGNKGFTPLHVAAEFDHREVAALLIVNGADINAKTDARGKFTPLQVAKKKKSSKVQGLIVAIQASGQDLNNIKSLDIKDKDTGQSREFKKAKIDRTMP